MSDPDPIQCVGTICFRDDQVLLIKRAMPPRKGEWSIPGGRIEVGETEQAAALRELLEETGIIATLGPKVEKVEAHFEDKSYDLHDYAAKWISGEPTPNDEVLETRFFPMADIHSLGMWPKTVEVIESAAAILKAQT